MGMVSRFLKSSSNQFLLFFFRAEDGIRDGHVTGVQTCALPICNVAKSPSIHSCCFVKLKSSSDRSSSPRSEERRVGKECRSRLVLYNEKKRYRSGWEQKKRDEIESRNSSE